MEDDREKPFLSCMSDPVDFGVYFVQFSNSSLYFLCSSATNPSEFSYGPGTSPPSAARWRAIPWKAQGVPQARIGKSWKNSCVTILPLGSTVLAPSGTIFQYLSVFPCSQCCVWKPLASFVVAWLALHGRFGTANTSAFHGFCYFRARGAGYVVLYCSFFKSESDVIRQTLFKIWEVIVLIRHCGYCD